MLKLILLYLMFYMVFMSIISLILIRKHIFMCLLSLEFVVVFVLLIYIYYCLMFTYSFSLVMIMMVFFVCEGVLGLSVLVSMIRFLGNDYLYSMFLW